MPRAAAGFWIYEGFWLHAVGGSPILYVPVVVVALYSLTFVGIFFNVALAGVVAAYLDGEDPSLGYGIDVALDRVGAIAAWAAFSLFVSFALSLLDGKLTRWVGAAARVAWSFATIFVIPLIAIERDGASSARRRSTELARANWQAESGGLTALRLAWLIPGLLFYLDGKLLFSGHVHALAAQVVLGLVLLAGFGVAAAVGVIRQVFAVELYRSVAQPAANTDTAP